MNRIQCDELIQLYTINNNECKPWIGKHWGQLKPVPCKSLIYETIQGNTILNKFNT